MKSKLVNFLLILLAWNGLNIRSISLSQTPVAPINTASPNTIEDLERRVSSLETEQESLLETLRSSNDYNQFLITGIGAIVTLLVAIQGVVAYRQSNREQELGKLEDEGINRVNDIMGVVQNTLQSRLDAEKQAREDALQARGKLEDVYAQIEGLKQFLTKYQDMIKGERQRIESMAASLARTARHDFRKEKDLLSSFAQKYNSFCELYLNTELESEEFSSRVLYAKGIADHYFNQPEEATKLLSQVSKINQPLNDETQTNCDRRISNSFYYLGTIESNFDNNEDAIKYFEEAKRLSGNKDDLLTMVVIAEAYLMQNNFEKTDEIIQEILRYPASKDIHTRLKNRAKLLMINSRILRLDENWEEEAKKVLEQIHAEDPFYYYATTTLGQLYLEDNPEKSRDLFNKAHEAIVSSSDLITLQEIRSKILLLLVAAICCVGAAKNNGDTPDEYDRKLKQASDYLNRAIQLRENLPKKEANVCTVFSPLSKRNERSETINDHIERIRRGQIELILPR